MALPKEIMGRQGGARVFFTPDGSMESKFAWGLGIDTNNMAEALVLWQGLRIARELGISNLIIIGDSRGVIRAPTEKILPIHLGLMQLLRKIMKQASLFNNIEFYHVLRANNPHVDLEANKGAYLSTEEPIFNEKGVYFPPP